MPTALFIGSKITILRRAASKEMQYMLARKAPPCPRRQYFGVAAGMAWHAEESRSRHSAFVFCKRCRDQNIPRCAGLGRTALRRKAVRDLCGGGAFRLR